MSYSLSEYILYINLRFLAFVFRLLPLGIALSIGRSLGLASYWLDLKHRKVAYRNLRIAFSERYSIPQLKSVLKRNYQNFGMNIVEALRLPKIDEDYINRYIKIKGREYLDNALKTGKGAIILTSHFGSWEILFALAGKLGYPCCILAEEQTRNPLLSRFLNQTREERGVRILKAGKDSREVIAALKEGMFLGLVADHGIKEGVLIDFFGRKVRTPTLAVRLSIKLNVPILKVYLRRVKGPEHEVVVFPPLELKNTHNSKQDVISNLETINRIMQDYINIYPEQYLWSYKRFKQSSQRNVLILHDARAGHLRQAEALVSIILREAKERELDIKIKQVEVRFKNRLSSILQAFSVTLASRRHCQGCLWCIKHFLLPDVFRELQSYFADIVISCGAQTAAVNYVISSENQAKSIVIMRPGVLSTSRFDLVIIPAHDNPPEAANIVKTDGALNLVNEEYIRSQASCLRSQVRIEKDLVLGLLLGGDTKKFKPSLDLLKPLISQIKLFLEKQAAEILISTSRRTSPQIQELIKGEFGNYRSCKLLVIANERNIPEAVGGILGLASIIIVSPESISMVSEAASSGKYVVVFKPMTDIGSRHNRFLRRFTERGYIYLSEASRILSVLEKIITQKPEIVKLQDSQLLRKAVGRLLC